MPEEGRWIILVGKKDNFKFILCNIYGHNNKTDNKKMFTKLSIELKKISSKYPDSTIILGGDFNKCINKAIDRFPSKAAEYQLLNSNICVLNLILPIHGVCLIQIK